MWLLQPAEVHDDDLGIFELGDALAGHPAGRIRVAVVHGQRAAPACRHAGERRGSRSARRRAWCRAGRPGRPHPSCTPNRSAAVGPSPISRGSGRMSWRSETRGASRRSSTRARADRGVAPGRCPGRRRRYRWPMGGAGRVRSPRARTPALPDRSDGSLRSGPARPRSCVPEGTPLLGRRSRRPGRRGTRPSSSGTCRRRPPGLPRPHAWPRCGPAARHSRVR